jgi:hypothetical protein
MGTGENYPGESGEIYSGDDIKHISTKFIKKALSNLTVTVDSWERKVKTYVYSNFDAINTMVLRSKWGVS